MFLTATQAIQMIIRKSTTRYLHQIHLQKRIQRIRNKKRIVLKRILRKRKRESNPINKKLTCQMILNRVTKKKKKLTCLNLIHSSKSHNPTIYQEIQHLVSQLPTSPKEISMYNKISRIKITIQTKTKTYQMYLTNLLRINHHCRRQLTITSSL